MKLFILSALLLPALSFASECAMTRNYTGSGATAIDYVYAEVSSTEECFKAAISEIGKTRVVRVRKPRRGYRSVKVSVTSVNVKTVIDDVRIKGLVRETRKSRACQVKELIKFLGNDWQETESTDLSSCLNIAADKLTDKRVKFRVSEGDFLFKGNLKKLSTK